MRPKSIVLLLLALGCGLVASIGITQVIKRPAKEVTLREGMTPILVAMAEIPMGEPINSTKVKLEQWPQDNVPEGALTKLSDIEGRRSRTEIFAGEPIISKKLLPKGATTSTATEFIPKGYRVVAVDVEKSDGAGLIMPGDRVDVLLHVRRNENMGISEDRTQTILQGIKVFAVDDTFKLGGKDKSNVSISAKTISLLVTPQQAEKLDLGTQLGKVRLVMRGMNDEEVVTSDSISVGDLLGTTEGANREAEDKGLASKKGGLMGLLGGMQNNKPLVVTQTPDVDETRQWTVRILQGAEVEDSTLEEVKEGDIVHWRVKNMDKEPGYSSAEPSGFSTPVNANQPDVEPDPAGAEPDNQDPDS